MFKFRDRIIIVCDVSLWSVYSFSSSHGVTLLIYPGPNRLRWWCVASFPLGFLVFEILQSGAWYEIRSLPADTPYFERSPVQTPIMFPSWQDGITIHS